MLWSRPGALSAVSTRRRSESRAGEWALMWSHSQGTEDGCPGSGICSCSSLHQSSAALVYLLLSLTHSSVFDPALNPPQVEVDAGLDSTWLISSRLRLSLSLFSETYVWMNDFNVLYFISVNFYFILSDRGVLLFIHCPYIIIHFICIYLFCLC